MVLWNDGNGAGVRLDPKAIVRLFRFSGERDECLPNAWSPMAPSECSTAVCHVSPVRDLHFYIGH